ncbi:unnamed protein product, partial [Porites evermanni]
MGNLRKGSQYNQKKTSRKKPRRKPIRLTGVSQQRRKANERERRRVQTLNSHIEILRDHIPLPPLGKRPTNTQVIWMAATYIEFLTELLKKSEKPSEFPSKTFSAEEQSVSQGLDAALDATASDLFCLDEGCSPISELDPKELFLLTGMKAICLFTS